MLDDPGDAFITGGYPASYIVLLLYLHCVSMSCDMHSNYRIVFMAR